MEARLDPHRFSLVACTRSSITTVVLLACAFNLSVTSPLPGHEGVAPVGAVVQGANAGTPSFEPFPADGVQLLSWLSLEDLEEGFTGGDITTGADCWGYVSPSGREYALITHSEGTTVVEITEPAFPEILETIDGPPSLWRDVKVYDHYAYAVSEGGDGIQVIDLDLVDDGTVTLVGTVTTGGNVDTHNVAIDTTSGYLYRCGGGSDGLRIYDLADPANPTFVAEWSTRYVHDVEVFTYEGGVYDGSQIAFCAAGGGSAAVLTILDVTDKDAIVQLSELEYADNEYSHQCWLSDDQSYLFLNDELDEVNLGIPTTTRILDVSDLEAPFEAGTFTNGLSATDHNLYTLGTTIFESNYRSGLRVFDATDPLDPTEFAYFDTWPEDDDAGFNGLWSCYPLFPSGTIIGSDLEKGLFVWRLGDPPLTIEFDGGAPTLWAPGETKTVTITALDGYELDPVTPQLHYTDPNTGEFVATDLTEVTAGVYDATLPGDIECGTLFSYYVSAATLDGIPSTDPVYAPHWTHCANAADVFTGLVDEDMESGIGWSVVTSATTGGWVRVDPNGTIAQPEDDTSEPGTLCWVTGQGPAGGGAGTADIDGGSTTLTSPAFDLTGATDPILSYSRWYSNSAGVNPESDTMVVEISDNDGIDWLPLEEVGPSGPDVQGGWIEVQFRVLDSIALTSDVRVRFTASDLGEGSLVEAAIDDLRIGEFTCDACAPYVRGDATGDGAVTFLDALEILGYLFQSFGTTQPLDALDANSSGAADLSDAIFVLSFVFLDGEAPAAPYPDPDC